MKPSNMIDRHEPDTQQLVASSPGKLVPTYSRATLEMMPQNVGGKDGR